jgi:DNA repair exonuclease SbcCD ATPase subunit
LKATDATRKSFLISLLGLDEYVEYQAIIKTIFSTVTRSVDECRGSIKSTRNWLDTKDKVSTEKKTLTPVVDMTSEIRDEIAETNSDITNNDNINAVVRENKKRIKRKAILREIVDEYCAEDYSDIPALEKECDKEKQESANASAMLNKLDKLDETCPTCLSPIDEDRVSAMRYDFESIVDTNTPKIAKLSKEIKTQYDARRAYIKQDEASKELETIEILDAPDKEVDLEELQAHLAVAKKELAEMVKEMDAITAENLAVAKHNDRIDSVAEQKETYRAELVLQEEMLGGLEERLARLVVLRRAFSTKGLVAYKIESMVTDLEDLINEYLQQFSDGRFTLTFTVTGDKLNVELTDDGQSIDINTLSSGELARVNTSTLLAIRKLLSSLASNRLNLLFLDEILNVLDEFGKQKLIEILNAEEGLNTFIVSHGWEHPLVAKLHVEKRDNVSRITDG